MHVLIITGNNAVLKGFVNYLIIILYLFALACSKMTKSCFKQSISGTGVPVLKTCYHIEIKVALVLEQMEELVACSSHIVNTFRLQLLVYLLSIKLIGIFGCTNSWST
jgi:hypothetical protein